MPQIEYELLPFITAFHEMIMVRVRVRVMQKVVMKKANKREKNIFTFCKTPEN
jgi:hypothetical protein